MNLFKEFKFLDLLMVHLWINDKQERERQHLILTDIKCLSTNYRSEENIVLFNNAFFSKAAEFEAEQLKAQNIPYNEQICKKYRKFTILYFLSVLRIHTNIIYKYHINTYYI